VAGLADESSLTSRRWTGNPQPRHDGRMKMHDDQLHVDTPTARRLIAGQFPRWRDEPIRALATDATVNSIFRVGSTLSARFPLRADDPGASRSALEAEAAASRELALYSSVAVPTPVAIGEPGEGYPLNWSLQTWLHGRVATSDSAAGSAAFARDLASLIAGLRRASTRGRTFSGGGRGGDLHGQDDWMAECFRSSGDLVDVAALSRLWSQLRELPSGGADVMSHRDLIPPNLLLRGNRLVGVLDGGGFGPADPALDLVAGWHLLDRDRRAVLRVELGSDELEWQRGRAWAFAQAMGLGWYYRDSNPGMSRLGLSTLARVLHDT
jgi:aminoglycoside phosphotransferase (APT) family kinase protein